MCYEGLSLVSCGGLLAWQIMADHQTVVAGGEHTSFSISIPLTSTANTRRKPRRSAAAIRPCRIAVRSWRPWYRMIERFGGPSAG